MNKVLYIAAMIAGICGCAVAPPSDPSRCYDCVGFRVFDADLRRTGKFVKPDALQVCGAPITPEEVTVLELKHGESIEDSVNEQLGMTAIYTDQWFGVALQPDYVGKAKRTIAWRGCNLLILGEKTSSRPGARNVEDISGTEDYLLIRWGKH